MQKFFQKIFHISAKIFFLALLVFITSEAVFAEHSFTDISPNDAYHSAVNDLFDARIISDDGTHLFKPNNPMNRDFFVSLATAIGCKQCLTPTSDDLVKFAKSPFVDLPKTNQFYYCIAYAADEGITQWYNIDPNRNEVSCENGQNFSSSPFCADNKISRIEAAAMLLRRAKLWDDNKNTGFSATKNFSDVSPYWQWYAEKAIEMELISVKNDNSIGQDEKITRGEFAIMASKILGYTQCDFGFLNQNNSIAGSIDILDSNGRITPSTTFIEWENFTFTPKTEPGNYNYSWTATPLDSNNSPISGNEKNFPGNNFPTGKWKVDVKITDPNTGKAVSNPSVTITILPKNPNNNADTDGDGIPDISDKCPTVYGPANNQGCPLDGNNDDIDGDGITNNNDRCPYIPGPISNQGCPNPVGLGVSLVANPNVTHIDNPINFTPIINGNIWNIEYNWDFGDGSRSTNPGNNSHSYTTPWAKTVTLTITDKTTGETAQTTIIIRITDDKDSDGDGILDSNDQCKNVRGVPPTGCPNINTQDYGCTIRGVYNGNINCPINTNTNPTDNDTDDDGLKDPKDPSNPQNPNNTNGSPSNNGNSSNDENPNSQPEDHCMYIPGPISNLGCPINGDGDDDGDGILNKDDRCPTIPWTVQSFGCPDNNSTDSDGDGIPDWSDKCPQVRGQKEWSGCPYPEVYSGITQNVCLLNKLNSTGLITGTPSCNACPCTNQVEISSFIRECDVIFPTILSPDKKTIYSRGNFYLFGNAN